MNEETWLSRNSFDNKNQKSKSLLGLAHKKNNVRRTRISLLHRPRHGIGGLLPGRFLRLERRRKSEEAHRGGARRTRGGERSVAEPAVRKRVSRRVDSTSRREEPPHLHLERGCAIVFRGGFFPRRRPSSLFIVVPRSPKIQQCLCLSLLILERRQEYQFLFFVKKK